MDVQEDSLSNPVSARMQMLLCSDSLGRNLACHLNPVKTVMKALVLLTLIGMSVKFNKKILVVSQMMFLEMKQQKLYLFMPSQQCSMGEIESSMYSKFS